MTISRKTRHPAKYSDDFIPIFANYLTDKKRVLDPFAGTGKIGKIKEFGYKGCIFANEIEREWLECNEFACDVLTFEDAETLEYAQGFFDAICTSPTYGNRMADHFKASDGSKRMTYTHCLGHELKDGNTGKMQWGEAYQRKHEAIYRHLYELLCADGLFILNISNHIRRGIEVDVSSWHKDLMQGIGFTLIDSIKVETPRMKFGANRSVRVGYENIYIFKKGENDGA